MRKKGFTLIELIVVMAIISILILLGTPKYKEYTKQAEITKLTVETKELETASQQYYIRNNDWPRLSDDAYTKEEIVAFGEKILDKTGKIVELESDGNYYDIDYAKIDKYISKVDSPENYILQNPVGNVYSIEGVIETRKLIFNEDLPDEVIEEIGAGNIKKISAGANHTVILMKDGTVKACGVNVYGQLGLGTMSSLTTNIFTTIPDLTNIIDIEVGSTHTVALKEDGTVWTWGYNYYGQLGIGNKVNVAKPTKVPNVEGAKQVAAGSNHTAVLLEDGTVKSWGSNYYAQLGISGKSESLLAIAIPNLENVKELVTENHTTIAILNDGTVKGWGSNNRGQLGIGTTAQMSTPTEIIAFTGAKKIVIGTYHTIALMNDGKVKTCGYNIYGALITGDNVDRLTPVEVPNLIGVKDVAAGDFYTVVLFEDGTLKSCGYNKYGQLGIGNTTNQLLLVDVPNLINAKYIEHGSQYMFALLEDGTVRAWGLNTSGQLGLNSTADKSVPTIVTIE